MVQAQHSMMLSEVSTPSSLYASTGTASCTRQAGKREELRESVTDASTPREFTRQSFGGDQRRNGFSGVKRKLEGQSGIPECEETASEVNRAQSKRKTPNDGLAEWSDCVSEVQRTHS